MIRPPPTSPFSPTPPLSRPHPPPVLPEDVPEVRRQRVQVPEVDRRNRLAVGLGALDGGGDGAVGPPPPDHQEVAGGGPVDRGRRNLLGDAPHLLGARPHHMVVVVRVVGDVAGPVLLLDATDPVL